MLGNYYYLFNVKAEPFTNPDVRKAFPWFINRKEIVKNIVKVVRKKRMHLFHMVCLKAMELMISVKPVVILYMKM